MMLRSVWAGCGGEVTPRSVCVWAIVARISPSSVLAVVGASRSDMTLFSSSHGSPDFSDSDLPSSARPYAYLRRDVSAAVKNGASVPCAAFLTSAALVGRGSLGVHPVVEQRRLRRCAATFVACIARSELARRHGPVLARQSEALAAGTWFKMICGASSQDLPRIRNLALVYAALGADCIDAAADPAVVRAVRDGFAAARILPHAADTPTTSPWLMISVNADEDPHFRKAVFEPSSCPLQCPRPCEAVCPAEAINATGVLTDICYGCGRCIPVCPSEIVSAVPFVHTPSSIKSLIASVDALEIHTELRQAERLRILWDSIGQTVCCNLQLLAISFTDPGRDGDLDRFLSQTWDLVGDIPPHVELVWQTDGRPMSGDIGKGTARASVLLGGRVRRALTRLGIPGHVQLAGGTNDATAPLLRNAGLFHCDSGVAGIAVGGYARKVCRAPVFLRRACIIMDAVLDAATCEIDGTYVCLSIFVFYEMTCVQILGSILDELQSRGVLRLEEDRELLMKALETARPLVQSIKDGYGPG